MTQTTITQGFLDHNIFKIISQTAAEKGVNAYVIGGYVLAFPTEETVTDITADDIGIYAFLSGSLRDDLEYIVI